jgi:hypothetical protein
VLEHLEAPERVLAAVFRALRSGGEFAITVPFIIKLHQTPYDFCRYTHFRLARMLADAGFNDLRMEAVYTPRSLLRTFFNEAFAGGSQGSALRRMGAALARRGAWAGVRIAERLAGGAPYRVAPIGADGEAVNPWVTGYHVLVRKP